MTKKEAGKWAILFAAYSNGWDINTVGLNAPDFEDLFVADSGDHDACPDDFKIDPNAIDEFPWVYLKDGLPDDNEFVLTFSKTHRFEIARHAPQGEYAFDVWVTKDNRSIFNEHIIAWVKLPEPPK